MVLVFYVFFWLSFSCPRFCFASPILSFYHRYYIFYPRIFFSLLAVSLCPLFFCILLYFSSHFGLVLFPSLLPVSINHSCLLPFRCFSFIAFPRPRLVCPFVRSQLHFLLILIPLHNRLPFLSYFARVVTPFLFSVPSLPLYLISSFLPLSSRLSSSRQASLRKTAVARICGNHLPN